MPVPPLTIQKPKLLLGEGNEEVVFFNALFAYQKRTDIQTADYEGKANLASFLGALVQPPHPGFGQLVALAITRDADDDPVGAYQSVCSALQSAGLPVPPAPGQSAGNNPRIHVFILPDGVNPGMLGNLCLTSVQSDAATACVDDFFDCVTQRAKRQPKPTAKARLHCWLSSMLDPDLRLGEAAQKGYFPWADPAFDGLKHFLHSL